MQETKYNILIYAHYMPPDKASTGQLLQELAEGLLSQFNVTVICVVPSYLGNVDEKYTENKFYEENLNGVKLFRIRVPAFDKTNPKSRIKNIMGYFFGAIRATLKVGKQDYVFALSQPPIMGGLLGVWGKWIKHAKFIYNIQDFNPEQISAIDYAGNKMILCVMMMADKFSCRRSDLVITVGRDLGETLENRFSHKNTPKYTIINNWANEDELFPLPGDNKKILAFKRQYGLENKYVFEYSGNIGLYYDLEGIITVIEKFKRAKTVDSKDVVFAFIGAGGVLDNLKEYVAEHEMDNVVFIPYQDKKDLIYSLNAGDVHWCINAKNIKGVSCPSKFYGIAAVGKPVLGVLEEDSEIYSLIKESQCGRVQEPKDYDAIADEIRWFIDHPTEAEEMGKNGRDYFEKHLSKQISIHKYIENILNI